MCGKHETTTVEKIAVGIKRVRACVRAYVRVRLGIYERSRRLLERVTTDWQYYGAAGASAGAHSAAERY